MHPRERGTNEIPWADLQTAQLPSAGAQLELTPNLAPALTVGRLGKETFKLGRPCFALHVVVPDHCLNVPTSTQSGDSAFRARAIYVRGRKPQHFQFPAQIHFWYPSPWGCLALPPIPACSGRS